MKDESVTYKYLETLHPGKIPEKIFVQLLRLFPASCIEVVPIRVQKNKVQVLLTKRPSNDPIWPKLWHVPGTMLTTKDKKFEDAFKRVMEEELNDIAGWESAGFASNLLHESTRGMESAVIYWLELPYRIRKPKNSKFFDRHKLPKDIIKSHKEVIELAVKSYLGVV